MPPPGYGRLKVPPTLRAFEEAMDNNIDDILNGTETEAEPVATEAEAVAPEPVAEEPKGPARGPDGKFIPKGEDDVPPASEDHVPIAAIKDERRKRQELEQRIADYERRLQELSNPPEPPADMFDNPEGWQNQFGQHVTSQASLNARLDTSEMLAAQAHDDFEDMRPVILEMLDQNPQLRQEVLSSRHPWDAAYKKAKNLKRAEELSAVDVDDMRAKIRAEVEAELKASQPQVAIPDSLAGAQSGRLGAAYGGPPQLSDLLK